MVFRLIVVLLILLLSRLSLSLDITLFQVIDKSHISLWINWWLIAIELDVIPKGWTYYCACFGDIDSIIKQYHSPGCTKSYLTTLHQTHIYYAKWLSISDAFKTKQNLLCLDIDTVMIRNPSHILGLKDNINSYDIIASRDHGPGNLEFSNNWGNARLCTGFLYLRYSKYLEEFVNSVLKRCQLYGHDQIQFNKLCSRSSLLWNDPPSVMSNDSIDHEGSIPWFSQTSDPNFVVIDDFDLLKDWKMQNDTINYMINKYTMTKYNETIVNKMIEASKKNSYSFRKKFTIKILNKYSILRYCSGLQNKGRTWPQHLKINSNLNKKDIKDLTVLHCFTFNGNINEQGEDKGAIKLIVLEALNLWVLNNTFKSLVNTKLKVSSSFNGSNFLYPQSGRTNSFIHQMINYQSLHKLKSIWLEGNLEFHKTLYELNPAVIRLQKKNRKKRIVLERKKKKIN